MEQKFLELVEDGAAVGERERVDVVAQVVAPRTTSDPVSYDHPAWVQRALARMFGG